MVFTLHIYGYPCACVRESRSESAGITGHMRRDIRIYAQGITGYMQCKLNYAYMFYDHQTCDKRTLHALDFRGWGVSLLLAVPPMLYRLLRLRHDDIPSGT